MIFVFHSDRVIATTYSNSASTTSIANLVPPFFIYRYCYSSHSLHAVLGLAQCYWVAGCCHGGWWDIIATQHCYSCCHSRQQATVILLFLTQILLQEHQGLLPQPLVLQTHWFAGVWIWKISWFPAGIWKRTRPGSKQFLGVWETQVPECLEEVFGRPGFFFMRHETQCSSIQ